MATTRPAPEAPDAEALAAKFERNRHLLPFFADRLPPLPEVQWPPLDNKGRLDRAVGCLLGLAIGDAMGASGEFLARDTYATITGLDGGGPLGLAPGEWTDATAMALCLTQSLLACKSVEQDDFMTRLKRWMTEGENTVNGRCIAAGATTQAAIERFIQDDEPAAGSSEGATAGNGSLIRLAPLAIFSAGSADRARFWAAKQSRCTHATVECLNACELLVTQLVDALAGADKAAALRPRIMKLTPNTLAINGGEWKAKTREQINSGAYVVETLEAALWSVWNTDNFSDAVLLAANLGGDPSGVAAVAGQLAGALYGVSSIPADWRKRVAGSSKLLAAASALLKASEA